MPHAKLTAIRHNIRSSVGNDVELVCRSRRKESTVNGILEGAYASLFTIRVGDGDEARLHSYTYIDVLTRNVTLRRSGNPSKVPESSTLTL